ncbi:DALR anticodon-binding domain-containing protein [Novosphingobium album (ex Liu et al. 2023)]|uniref:DALR anticodon-binding domain-containing protein n=1 Tax=Novosphingobium album (ex Liu et al. 2023) TaxID=3031130 RepID=A0ABT5WKV2_9SPHN|nr:DALR anticodon-binding domain-containing protein [Novosphingobium album (ex Liu et al. 2023)]MDE8650678.1 DALR anticodon-binding domain-containing protein [Novosphingobium album (ex Liu et al. 2023)]
MTERAADFADQARHWVASPEGAAMLALYRRVADLLKQADWQGIEGEIARTGEEDPLANVDDPDLAPVIAAKMADRHRSRVACLAEPAETALMAVLDFAERALARAMPARDFPTAVAALATLRDPVEGFLTEVRVDDADPDKRRARLELLDRFIAAMHNVADFSMIQA